jgi:hypothetical protein
MTERAARAFRGFDRTASAWDSFEMDRSAITRAFDAAGQMRLVIRHAWSADSDSADVRALKGDD